ncbi:MAG: peptidoglycan DD-metalloendopeptidase family protein [Lachnospiraceae bacterium]|nr:peptidoglycan DD-metalloendopeptidase family protein [Lachnospiraceae bacterium]
MKNSVKRYLIKGILFCFVLFALVSLPEQKVSANRISDLEASIQEKEEAIDAAEKEKKELAAGLTSVENVKKELEKSKANLTAYVQELDAAVAEIQTKIENLNTQIADKEKAIAETKAELKEAEQDEADQYEAMQNRMQSIYEQGDNYYLELLSDSGSFADFLNKLDYIEQLSQYDNNLLLEYKSVVEYVSLCKTQLEVEQEVLNETKKAAEAEQAAMETLIGEKEAEILAYEKDITQKEQVIAAYEAEIAEQTSVIEALEAAVAADRASLWGERVYNGGMFCWPAPSYTRISDDYGYRNHPILNVQQFHTGVDMAAPGGTPILAAYDGVVVQAAYNASMGNYVMIDHGSELYTIYMHAQKLMVSPGDEVARGEQIATVGTTGRSTGNHLHFSVRLNGSYVSPWGYISKP